VQPKRVFLQVLMQEQGWGYRPSGADQPSLRDRLVERFGIDGRAIEEKVRDDSAASRQNRRSMAR